MKFIIFLLLYSFIVCEQTSFGQQSNLQTVLRYNKHNIDVEEFLWWIQQNKSACYSYFLKKYGPFKSSGFWSRNFDGECPLERLINMTLENVKNNYDEITLIQQFGILQGFDVRNIRIKQTGDNGCVYGNIPQDDFNYYDYILSNAKKEIEQKISAQYRPDKTILLHLYDSLKCKMFKKHSNIRVAISQSDKKRNVIRMDTIEFEEQSEKADEAKWNGIFTTAMRFDKVGDTSIYKDDFGHEFCIKCLQMQDNGFLSFEEIEDNLISLYADILFNKMLKKINEGHNIVVNRQNLKHVEQIFTSMITD